MADSAKPSGTSTRLVALDLARGFAILAMIWVHILLIYALPSVQLGTAFGLLIYWLGTAPAAPVFMTLLGISSVYSRSQTLKAGVIRGLRLIAIAYLLNLFRYTLPLVISQAVRSPESFAWIKSLTQLGDPIFALDILQLAGLSLIVLALIRQYLNRQWLILAAAIAIVLISPSLWGITSGNPVLDYGLAIVVGGKGESTPFPLFPWLSFPLIGAFLGRYLRDHLDLNRAFRKIFLVGLGLFVLGLIISAIDPVYHFGDFYHSAQGGMIYMIGFVLSWLGLLHWLAQKQSGNAVFSFLQTLSKDVLPIYLIQWCVIVWGTALIRYQSAEFSITVILLIAITLICLVLNRTYAVLKPK